MSKQKNERRLAPNEASATLNMTRISGQKLNLLAQLIRGKAVGQAIQHLALSKKRAAKDVEKLLLSAVSNAENNHGLDIDSLYVSEAYVGKSLVMKRIRARARGRAARILKPFSRLDIILREEVAE